MGVMQDIVPADGKMLYVKLAPVSREILQRQGEARGEGLCARQGLLALLRQHDRHVSGHEAAAHMPPERRQARACALLNRP